MRRRAVVFLLLAARVRALAPVANPGATSTLGGFGGVMDAVAAKNAELLAVKEGSRLIKEVKKLPTSPPELVR